MKVINRFQIVWILIVAACNFHAQNFTFGKKFEIYDQDSLASKAYASQIRKLNAKDFKAGKISKNGIQVNYQMLSPEVFKKGKRYPLVLVFHGSGAIGTDNQKQINALVKNWIRPENRRKFPAFVLAPQFSVRSSNYHLDEKRKVLASESNSHLDMVLSAVDSLKKIYPIDERKIYAMGFSMGGSTTMNALSKRPDLFAAGINISGISEFDNMDELRTIPLWIVHGSMDTDNLPASNLKFFEEMAGRGKVFFWECKDKWHNNIVSKELLDHIPAWLFKQKKKRN